MRTGWKRASWSVGLVMSMVLGACGGSGDEEAADTTTEAVAETTVAPTTAAPATTVATTAATTAAPPTTAAPTTTALSGPGAPEQLAAFLGAYDGLTEQLPVLLDDVTAELEAAGEVSGDVDQRTLDAAGDVYDLTRLVPAGLDPSVFAAVHDAVMVMGAATSAYLYAPGWEPSQWPDWEPAMRAAQDQLPAMRAIVENAAATSPTMTAVASGSRAAAELAVLPLALARRFGHSGPAAEIDAPVPYVHWVGALPEGAAEGTPCFLDAATGEFTVPSGEFVDGVGGCAVVFYDGVDQPAEIEAWRADPQQLPSGEVVAFVLNGGAWEAIGSVE